MTEVSGLQGRAAQRAALLRPKPLRITTMGLWMVFLSHNPGRIQAYPFGGRTPGQRQAAPPGVGTTTSP